jgi:hypothetical protein
MLSIGCVGNAHKKIKIFKSYSTCIDKTLTEYEKECKSKKGELSVSLTIHCDRLNYKYDVDRIAYDINKDVLVLLEEQYFIEKTCRDSEKLWLTKVQEK